MPETSLESQNVVLRSDLPMKPLPRSLGADRNIAGVEDVKPLAKRDPEDCTDGNYEASNGLNFEIQCYGNVPLWDLPNTAQANSIEDCIEQCAYSMPACYGVVYSHPDLLCFRKTREALSRPVRPERRGHWARVDVAQYEPLDTSCPTPDRSQLSAANGMNFTVYCQKDFVGADVTLNGMPRPNTHTETLQECLDFCAAADGRCLGVAWNPDLLSGYENCYPKSSTDEDRFVDLRQGFHAALVADPPPDDAACADEPEFKAAGGQTFDVRCGRSVPGDALRTLHADSMQECVDSCADFEDGDGCAAVMFDETWAHGFENCVLKGPEAAEQETVEDADYAVAVLTSSGGGSARESEPSDGEGGGSKAWIAGPVVGAVALIVLLIGAIVFWRRRKQRQSGAVKYGAQRAELDDSEKPRPTVWYEMNHHRDEGELQTTERPQELKQPEFLPGGFFNPKRSENFPQHSPQHYSQR